MERKQNSVRKMDLRKWLILSGSIQRQQAERRRILEFKKW